VSIVLERVPPLSEGRAISIEKPLESLWLLTERPTRFSPAWKMPGVRLEKLFHEKTAFRLRFDQISRKNGQARLVGRRLAAWRPWQPAGKVTIIRRYAHQRSPHPTARAFTEPCMAILEAIHVTKEYGSQAIVRVHALRGVDARVEPGEFLAIMGPSGCGKSTLLHLLGGIDPPTTGQVLLDGEDFGSLNDTQRSIVRRRRLGFVFQKMNLLPTLSAEENVALPLRIDGAGRKAALAQARQVLERVDLAKRMAHFPHEMSGGEQQRVAIARALVVRPAVVLADEPTGALDSANGQSILQLLRECANQGQTVVMVTHDAEMARQADRLLLMHDGRIVSGAPADAVSASTSVPR
jgi:putative ABC transport system ATP-binding protein